MLTREELPDEYLADIEGSSWKENIAAREQIVTMHLQAFTQKMEKVFQNTNQVTYYLVFKSKLNDTDVTEH